jgi:hypothetical protein
MNSGLNSKSEKNNNIKNIIETIDEIWIRSEDNIKTMHQC